MTESLKMAMTVLPYSGSNDFRNRATKQKYANNRYIKSKEASADNASIRFQALMLTKHWQQQFAQCRLIEETTELKLYSARQAAQRIG